jgi:hypothetical protein
MNGETTRQPGAANDVDDAQREVERAERALSRSLHDASAIGKETMTRAFKIAKPVLIGVIAVGGVVWLVRRARRPKGRPWLDRPSERSVLAEAARAATLSLASAAARRIATQWLMGPEHADARNDKPPSRSHFD